jgi:hypothetical protein
LAKIAIELAETIERIANKNFPETHSFQKFKNKYPDPGKYKEIFLDLVSKYVLMQIFMKILKINVHLGAEHRDFYKKLINGVIGDINTEISLEKFLQYFGSNLHDFVNDLLALDENWEKEITALNTPANINKIYSTVITKAVAIFDDEPPIPAEEEPTEEGVIFPPPIFTPSGRSLPAKTMTEEISKYDNRYLATLSTPIFEEIFRNIPAAADMIDLQKLIDGYANKDDFYNFQELNLAVLDKIDQMDRIKVLLKSNKKIYEEIWKIAEGYLRNILQISQTAPIDHEQINQITAKIKNIFQKGEVAVVEQLARNIVTGYPGFMKGHEILGLRNTELDDERKLKSQFRNFERMIQSLPLPENSPNTEKLQALNARYFEIIDTLVNDHPHLAKNKVAQYLNQEIFRAHQNKLRILLESTAYSDSEKEYLVSQQMELLLGIFFKNGDPNAEVQTPDYITNKMIGRDRAPNFANIVAEYEEPPEPKELQADQESA